MATLNTVFKQVFGDALKEKGFVKIKSRYPYLVRVIAGETIQVIICRNEWNGEPEEKSFAIYSGVATVYRGEVDLTKSPSYNINWLQHIRSCYVKSHPFDSDADYSKSLFEFLYKTGDDESLHKEMEHALEETEKVILPVLDKIIDLPTTLEYFWRFGGPLIPPEYNDEKEEFKLTKFGEGLLLIQTNNRSDLTDIFEDMLAESIKLIECGKSPWTREREEKDLENFRLRILTNRDKIYNNPKLYQKALEELKRRKAINTEALRSCGLDL